MKDPSDYHTRHRLLLQTPALLYVRFIMASTIKFDYHYLRAAAPGSEPRQYACLDAALAAVQDLLHLQRGRGFAAIREPDGKILSRHPDGRAVKFWAENGHGDIVS
jgi:hypothetical protein